MRIVDLSIPIDTSTPFYPGDPEPRTCAALTIAEHGFAVSRLELGSHSGTHVDAPSHFHPDGPTLDELPLGRFAGPGVVVDATGRAPRDRIGWDAFEPHVDALRPGVIVLLRTGWDTRRGDPAYFDHPFLDGAVATELLALGVMTVGIDAINLDATPTGDADRTAFACHDRILGAGGVIVENLANLGTLPVTGAFVTVLPLHLPGLDGGPTRAAGFVGENAPHGH